jgi:hypothetical protein
MQWEEQNLAGFSIAFVPRRTLEQHRYSGLRYTVMMATDVRFISGLQDLMKAILVHVICEREHRYEKAHGGIIDRFKQRIV